MERLSSRNGGTVLLVLFGVVAGLPFLLAEFYLLDGGLGFPLDDSWIHLQFARNLAAGNGLSYNPGDLVTGSTAPLWTALLSLLFALPGGVVAAAKLLGVLTHGLTVLGSYHLSRELRLPPALAAASATLVALTSWLIWSAAAAMEVGLFCTLATFGMVLAIRERRDGRRLPLALPVFALSVLARPEGVLLLLLALFDQLVRFERREGELVLRFGSWRRAVSGLAVGGFVLVPVGLFHLWVGGSLLPSTFATKAGYGHSGLPSGQFLDTVQGILFQAQPVATLLAPIGILVLAGRLGGDRDRGLLPALWLVALPLAYAVLSSDRLLVGNFGRYFFVLFPALIVLAIVGWDELLRSLPTRLRWRGFSLRWPIWVGILLLVPTLFAMVRGIGLYTQSVLNVQDSDVAMAELLAPILPAQAVLAVNDIGALKFLLPNEVVDLAGIVTPEIHEYSRRSLEQQGSYHPGVLEFVHATRPDYIVVFPRWFPLLEGNPAFVPLLRLAVPDNITMGGDELVLYGTPWTRYPLTQPPEPMPPSASPSEGGGDR